MLKQLKLHNFRTYLNTDLSLSPRHLVIGRNNSGKTNLCAAFQFLSATASADLGACAQLVPGGVPEITNWAFDSKTVELGCTCELPFDGKPHQYSYELAMVVEPSEADATRGQLVLRVTHEELAVEGPKFKKVPLLRNDGHEAHMLHERDYESSGTANTVKTLAPRDSTMLSKLYELDTNRRAVAFRRYLLSWLYFALSPEAMRYGWRGNPSLMHGLSPHGENLAVVLFRLKNMDERRYRRVLDHVRLIEPELEAINFVPSPDQPAVPFVALRTPGPDGASWHGLSDGTLRCLALALVAEVVGGISGVSEPQPSPFVMIEEPENGIYPGQLRAFFDLLEDRTDGGQFLFTSHSPYFINFFDGDRDSVTLLRRNRERTEIVPIPPAEDDPDRPLLAEQYSMELFD